MNIIDRQIYSINFIINSLHFQDLKKYLFSMDIVQSQQTISFKTLRSLLITWKYIYLPLFALAQILAILLSISFFNKWVCLIIPFLLLISALSIRMSYLIYKQKITLKQFVKMQIQFTSPYLIMIINIILAMYGVQKVSQNLLFQAMDPNIKSQIGIASINFIMFTVLCSLIMNKRTTSKIQFYGILIIIVIQTFFQLKQNIDVIYALSQTIEKMDDLQNQNLMQYIDGIRTRAKYNQFYQIASDFVSAIQTSKDFILAQIASVIAQLLILIDLIARPLEKIQHQKQIHNEWMKNNRQMNDMSDDVTRNNEVIGQNSIRRQMIQQRQQKQIQLQRSDINQRRSTHM